MTMDEKIARINALAHKAKAEGLTDEEKEEQAQLRREEFTFFGLSESLEISAMRPMGHRPKANSAAIRIQPPTSTSFFFFAFPPPSSKRNEPVSGSYSKSLLIYLFSFFLPALAARSRSKSTIFVFLPVFSSST